MAFQKNESKYQKRKQGYQSWLKGIYAEIISVIFLWFKGYKIIGRRLKTKVGEIDVLCKKKNSIIVVEVKYRPNFSIAAYSITQHQMERLAKAIQWIEGGKYSMMKIRFDVLFIVPYKIPKHVKNIWQQSKY